MTSLVAADDSARPLIGVDHIGEARSLAPTPNSDGDGSAAIAAPLSVPPAGRTAFDGLLGSLTDDQLAHLQRFLGDQAALVGDAPRAGWCSSEGKKVN